MVAPLTGAAPPMKQSRSDSLPRRRPLDPIIDDLTRAALGGTACRDG